MPVWPVGSCVIVLFFLLLRRPRRSALFPYTTLFRSYGRGGAAGRTDDDPVRCVIRPMSGLAPSRARHTAVGFTLALAAIAYLEDRKSTRLNSSHITISYAVFCLKKKKYITQIILMSK